MNGVLIHAKVWMNHGNLRLREREDRQRDVCHLFHLHETSRIGESEAESRLVLTRSLGREEWT